MKIRVLSDLHLEMGGHEPPHVDSDLVILAGDTGKKRLGLDWALSLPESAPVLYLMGNHEYYGAKIPNQVHKLKQAAAGSHVQVVEKEVVEIGGWRILCATLWTDFLLFEDRLRSSTVALDGLADFSRIRVAPRYSRLHPNDCVKLHYQSVAWLKEELQKPGPSIVVTHHAPSVLSVAPELRREQISAAYASDLTELIEQVGPSLWIHGHTHHAVDYRIGSTRVLSNPSGYPDESIDGFDPFLMVDTATLLETRRSQ